MRVDLHVHTHCSDGHFSPADVYRMAKEAEIGVLALTDHDTVMGYDQALPCVETGGPRLLAGVEFTTAHGSGEIHILAYFPDGVPVPVREFLARTCRERRERMREGIDRLGRLGVSLDYQAVERLCQGDCIGRSHLARALVERGTVRTIQQAFQRYLASELEIIPGTEVSVADVIGLVAATGGASVWAHPVFDEFDAEIQGFRDIGLDGVEIHTPRGNGVRGLYFERVVDELGLLAAGGSDWHGFPNQGKLGRFTVSDRLVRPLLSRLGVVPDGERATTL